MFTVYSLQLTVNYDIDDAVGSGATINEIGRQILDKKVAKKTHWSGYYG